LDRLVPVGPSEPLSLVEFRRSSYSKGGVAFKNRGPKGGRRTPAVACGEQSGVKKTTSVFTRNEKKSSNQGDLKGGKAKAREVGGPP